jgi:hypothetical protein
MELEDEIVLLAKRIKENVEYRRRHADRRSFTMIAPTTREKTNTSIFRDIVSARQRLQELADEIKNG